MRKTSRDENQLKLCCNQGKINRMAATPTVNTVNILNDNSIK